MHQNHHVAIFLFVLASAVLPAKSQKWAANRCQEQCCSSLATVKTGAMSCDGVMKMFDYKPCVYFHEHQSEIQQELTLAAIARQMCTCGGVCDRTSTAVPESTALASDTTQISSSVHRPTSKASTREQILRKQLQNTLLAAEHGAPTPSPANMMGEYMNMAEQAESEAAAKQDDAIAKGIMDAHHIKKSRFDVEAVAEAVAAGTDDARMRPSSQQALSYLELESREMLKAKLQANMDAEQNGKATLSPEEELSTYIQLAKLSRSQAATSRDSHLAAHTMHRFDLSDSDARQAAAQANSIVSQLRSEAQRSGIRDPNSLGERAAQHRPDVDAYLRAPQTRGYGDTDSTHLFAAALLVAMFVGAFRTGDAYMTPHVLNPEEDWIGMQKRNNSSFEPTALERSLEREEEKPSSREYGGTQQNLV
jgi:hypothetical protein